MIIIIIIIILLLSNAVLQCVTRLKYLGVWFLAGKSFSVDHCVNRTKFLSAVFGILPECINIFEEILWNVIQCSCLPIFYMALILYI